MGLLNVRLDRDMTRKVEALREQGVVISKFLRESIDTEYARRQANGKGIDIDQLVADLQREYPTPSPERPIPIDVANRRAAQAYIFGKMQEKMYRTSIPRTRKPR